MRKIIQQGETLRLYVGYTDIDTGESVDPITLSCTVGRPDGTSTTVTFPHADFVKVSVGEYFVRILGSQIGTHKYRILAELGINDKDVRDGKFDVETSP